MSTNNNDFIVQFDNSLKRLNGLKEAISVNTKNKTQFTGFVLSKLQELNRKIKEIVGKIKEIKSQLSALQGQINQNTSGIQNKDSEIVKLNEQVKKLTQEKKDLEEFLNTELPKKTQESVDLQKEIDEKENKLRELEAKNATLTNEKETLQKELSTRGDVPGQHAQEIQQLSEKNKLELEKLQQENLKEIQELQKQIADKESQIQSNLQKIQSLEQQIVDKDKKIAEFEATCGSAQQEQQQNASAIQSANDKIVQLQNEKAALQQMNDDLMKRIIAATEVINNATAQLEELTNQAFYDKSNQDVSAIINEIEVSLQQIINTIQGNTNVVANNQSQQSQPNQQRNRSITYQGQKLNVNDLLKSLKSKGEQVVRSTGNSNNKYIKAYSLINSNLLTNPSISDSDLINIISNALISIDIEADAFGVLVKGGYNMSLKKTKKYNKKMKSRYTRKQKGGYLWGKQKSSSIKSIKGK